MTMTVYIAGTFEPCKSGLDAKGCDKMLIFGEGGMKTGQWESGWKAMTSWDNKKFASNNLFQSIHLKKVTTKVKLQDLQYKRRLKKIMPALIFGLSVLSGTKMIWILHLPSCNHLNNFRS